MFERQVAYYLNKYLGQYVYNVDASALSISIFKGSVELHNLRLKPEALNSLNLPITVKSGLLGSLKLKVPWSNLGGSPVICELDSIFVLAVPNTDATQSSEDFLKAEQKQKQQRVNEAEQEFLRLWKESLEAREEQADAQRSGNKSDSTSGLQSFIETILGNLQLSITNVHIRYEDSAACPGETFACGLTLEEVSAFTVDDQGQRTFVSKNALEHLRKSARLRRLAVYFDVETAEYLPETGEWKKMARTHWNTLFLPGIAADSECPKRQYAVGPINGEMLYERLDEKMRKKKPDEPWNTSSLSLTTVQVHMSEAQMQCVQALLEGLSMHRQRAPHLHLRPAARPSGSAAVRRWWQYAIQATMGADQGSGRSMSWDNIARVSKIRKAYIPGYQACIKKGLIGGDDAIHKMDKELNLSSIIFFRKTAHLQFEKQRRAEAASQGKSSAGQPAASQGGGWLSYLGWGRGGGTAISTSEADFDSMFNEDDMEQLNSLLEEQRKQREEACREATTNTITSAISFAVESCSVVVSDHSNFPVLKAASADLHADVSLYPQTTDVRLSVAHIVASSGEETILTSEAMHGSSASHPVEVFSLHFIHMPQDGRADHVVDMVVQPTYLTYHTSAKERILDFVERNQQRHLGAIGATAGAIADNLATEVMSAVATAWQTRDTPRFLINLQMEAPRVALPVDVLQGRGAGTGGASSPTKGGKSPAGGAQETLVLDFGFFQLQSDQRRAESLPEPEALLYDCLLLSGRNVQANLLKGSFSWSRWEEMRGGAAVLSGYPLIEPIETSCSVDYGRFQHPTLPRLRAKAKLPKLSFHVSPARITRLMTLLNELTESSGADGAPKEPAWVKEIDFAGSVDVLRWSGVSFSNAIWEERWAAIWYGWLYVLEAKGSFKVVRSAPVFKAHALKVPPKMIGGMENVVALCQASQLNKSVIDSPDTLLICLPSPAIESQWLWQLHLAKQRMGLLLPESLVSRDSSDPLQGQYSSTITDLEAMVDSNPEDAVRKQESKIQMEMAVEVGQVKLAISGRTKDKWWPPHDSTGPAPSGRHEYQNESRLIIMSSHGMWLSYKMSSTHMEASSSLAALSVEDELVGPLKPSCRFLALSDLAQPPDDDCSLLQPSPSLAKKDEDVHQQEGGDEEEDEEEDVFYDALDKTFTSSFDSALEAASLASQQGSSRVGSAAMLDSMEDTVEGSAVPPSGTHLARITFAFWSPSSPLYKDVDSEATVELEALYFFCNRPTVAALMMWGLDVSQAISNSLPPPAVATDEGVAAAAAEEGGIVKGAEDRSTFRLHAQMKALDVVLNYEGGDAFPLLKASMHNSRFNLDLKPSTLNILATVGNLVAKDLSYVDGYTNSTICDLKKGNSSLIELRYSTHKGCSEAGEPRVPKNTDFSRLHAKLSTVGLVFLNRQVMEMMAYVNGLLALQPDPPSRDSLPEAASLRHSSSSRRRSFSSVDGGEMRRSGSSRPSGVPVLVLLLDVDMHAPVITMPLSSFSEDSIQLDLGHLTLSNSIAWEEHSGHRMLLDSMSIKVTGVTTSTVVGGKRSTDIIKLVQEDGFCLTLRRLLHGPAGVVPTQSMDVVVPEVDVDLKDREFRLIAAIASSNLNEPLNLPPGAVWLQRELGGPSQQGAGRPSASSGLPASIQEGEEELEGEDVYGSAPNLKMLVQLQTTRLRLLTTAEGVPEGEPLATLLIPAMTVNYQATGEGMRVAVAIPDVIVHDARPGILDSSRVVMSASSRKGVETAPGHGISDLTPSMVLLEYLTNVPEASATINIRLQQPTFVAETGFLKAVMSYTRDGSDSSDDYFSGDVSLQTQLTRSKEDLWLSPDCRLLADGEAADDYVLDGCGMRLVLPPGITQSEPLPLIIVGSGKSLRLCNFQVINPDSLAGALFLKPGAQLVAAEHDGVTMASPNQGDDEFADALSLSPEPQLGHLLSFTSHGDPAAAEKGEVTVNLTAVGVSLNFLDLMPGDQKPSGGGSQQQPEQSPSTPAGGPRAADPMTYMLTTSLDITMTYKAYVAGGQELDADLHDLLMETSLSAPKQVEVDPDVELIQPAGFENSSNLVLQPCDIAFHFESSENKTDIKLNTSDMVWTIGVDMLHIATRLQDRILGPLSRVPPDRPLATAPTFTKVWPLSSVKQPDLPPYSNPRDVDLFVSDRGFSIWRPKAPVGYAPLGDVVTQGLELPQQHAVCLAKDSSLVVVPSDYTLVRSEADSLWIWRPEPPEGFVAIGCVCTTTPDKPAPGRVYCVRRELVVQTAPGECHCMRIFSDTEEDGKQQEQLKHLRLWSVCNSACTFMAVVDSEGSGMVPAWSCLDLRSPLGVMPAALREHIAEAAKEYAKSSAGASGKLSSSPAVSRMPMPRGPTPGGSSNSMGSTDESLQGAEDAILPEDLTSQCSSYDVIAWDVALQRHLALHFVSKESQLRRSQKREQASIEVAEFYRVFVHSCNSVRGSFWRPILPAGYITLGDVMMQSLHPPKAATVFLDDSDSLPPETGWKHFSDQPRFIRPVRFEKMWEGSGIRKEDGAKRTVSLWKMVAPTGYVAVGWVAWNGNSPPMPEKTAVRCLREDLVEMLEDRPSSSETMVWEKQRTAAWDSKQRPSMGSDRGLSSHKKGKASPSLPDLTLWSTNPYTGTFWAESTAGAFPSFFTWSSAILDDEEANNLHAERTENPDYKVSLDTGLLSIMLLDMTGTPLLELNLAKDGALQGRRPSDTKRHGRHTKRCGCSATLLESAPGLLQAYLDLSVELWSFRSNHWDPVLEPFGVLVKFHNNTRSKMVKNHRPGIHISFKSTVDGLHLTVAHSALESLMQAFDDAQAVVDGKGAAMMRNARNGARFAMMDNSLGVPVHMMVDYGNDRTVESTFLPDRRCPFVMPRSVWFKRKQPDPQSIPKGMLLVDVNRLRLVAGASLPRGGLSVSVALAPSHELDQYMPVETRWVRCQDDGRRPSLGDQTSSPSAAGAGRFYAEWQEQLVLRIPDEEVLTIIDEVGERGEEECEADSISPLILQVAVTDTEAANGRGEIVALGLLEVRGEWLLEEIRAASSSGPRGLWQAVDLTASPVGSSCSTVGSGGKGEVWGQVGITTRLLWISHRELPSSSRLETASKEDEAHTLSTVKLRLAEDEQWRTVTNISKVLRSAGETPGEDMGPGTAGVGHPVLVRPMVLMESDIKRKFAIEESTEKGVRTITARSLCQVVNNTSVTLQVGLVRGTVDTSSGSSGSDSRLSSARDGSSASLGGGSFKPTDIIEIEGIPHMSVTECVFENQRLQSFRGFGSEGFLTPSDEAEGHMKYEWEDSNGVWRTSNKFPAMPLQLGWHWQDRWALFEVPGAAEGFIYGISWDDLSFPPGAGSEVQGSGHNLRRRMWIRTRLQAESDAAVSEGGPGGVEVLGWVQPRGKLALPLGWDAPNSAVVVRPVMSLKQQSSTAPAEEPDPAAAAQMGAISHSWSNCMTDAQGGIPLARIKDGSTFLLASPPSQPDHDPVQLIAPNKNLRKFTAFKGLVFWMSARVVANPLAEGMVDVELVVSPPLVLETLLPVGTEFKLWEKDNHRMRMRCEGELDSGGSVQVYAVDMRKEIYISLTPEGCMSADDPLLLYGRQGALPKTISLEHKGQRGAEPLSLYVEHRTASTVLDSSASSTAVASVARGSPLVVSLYAGLIVLNATQLPVSVSVEQSSRNRKQIDKDKAPKGSGSGAPATDLLQVESVHMRNSGATLAVKETQGLPAGTACSAGCCSFLPGAVHMMSYPLQSDYEYDVKVAMEGSSWGPLVSLDSDAPNTQWILRATIGQTGQVHEALVSVTTCTGAFGRSKILKLEPHIVVSNLTGFRLLLHQCLPPSEQIQDSQRRSLRNSKRGTSKVDSLPREASEDHSGPESSRRPWKTSPFKARRSGMFQSQGSPSSLPFPGRRNKGPNFSSAKDRSAPVQSPEAAKEPEPSFSQWPTDTLGVLDLQPGSIAVPMYWSSRCWKKSVCVQLSDPASDADSPTSSPIQLEYPGFEDVLLRLPVRSRPLEEGGGPPRLHSPEANLFSLHSSCPSSIKLRLALGGSPFCKQIPPNFDMQECYSDSEALVVRVSAQLKAFSSLHVIFHSVNAQAPNVVQNCSPHAILFRQVGKASLDWQLAHPWTSVPLVWDILKKDNRKIEAVELGMVGTRSAVQFNIGGNKIQTQFDSTALSDGASAGDDPDSQGEGSNRSSSAGALTAAGSQSVPLPTSDPELPCQLDLVQAGRRPHPMAGGTVVQGYGHVSAQAVGMVTRVQSLMVTVRDPRTGKHNAAAPLSSLQHMSERIYVSFNLEKMDISVVDHTPQELMLISFSGVVLEYATGLGPHNSFTNIHIKVKELQVDNMLPFTRYPVLLYFSGAQDDYGGGSSGSGASGPPTFEFVCVEEAVHDQAVLNYPYIFCSFERTLILNLCEALFWSSFAMYNSLPLAGAEKDNQTTDVQADTMVDIRLFAVGELRTQLSLGTDSDARAENFTGSFGYLFSLAAFKDLTYTLDGWERRDIHMPRSSLLGSLAQIGSNYVFGLGFRILRSSVSLRSASRAIEGVSGQVAKLSMDSEFNELRDQQRKQDVSNLKEGFRDGGEAFAKGLIWGVTGLVRRPMQGAQEGGAAGLLQGLGAGMVGAFAQPLSGAMDMVAKATEGAGASLQKATKAITGDDMVSMAERKRLPRAISGDQWLQPFNAYAAEGQNLMWRAKRGPVIDEIVNMRFRPVQISRSRGDKYEAHLQLPSSRYALITNCAVMMLSVKSDELSSSAAGVSDLTKSKGKLKVLLEWECTWEDILSFQLRRSRAAPVDSPPDTVVLHRKEGTSQGIMQHEWQCYPMSAQAEQLLEMLQSARLKYSDSYRGIRETEPLTPTQVGQMPQQLEQLSEPGLVKWFVGPWKLLWRSPSGVSVSIWRPVAPEGYISTGDVMVDGAYTPETPAVLMRKDIHLTDTALLHSLNIRPLLLDSPAVKQPLSFLLIWRSSGKGRALKYVAEGQGPISIWWPVAPEGYHALGCVAVPALEEPPLSLCACVRRDLLEPADKADKAAWQGVAGDKTSWRCSLWRINNSPSRTFFAARPESSTSIRQWRLSSKLLAAISSPPPAATSPPASSGRA